MTKLALANITSLGDQEIRELLIRHLSKASNKPKAILEELRVHNGNAIADVVSVHSYAHCYEIKSDKDSIERAKKQSQYYDLVFRRVTLVTTERHLEKAKQIIPTHWGIMVVKTFGDYMALSYIRGATNTPTFNKQTALLTLWKSELTEVALPITNLNITKFNRSMLTSLIAEKLGRDKLAKYIGNQLALRPFR